MAKILLIIHEENISDLLEDDLIKQSNHQVIKSLLPEEVIEIIKNDKIDIALIQLKKGEITDSDLISKIRSIDKQIRMIVIAEPEDELSIVDALNSGATTYMKKPISFRRLIAQINALLQDINYLIKKEEVISINDNIKINLLKREVMDQGRVIKLTKLEYELLLYLYQNKNKVLSRDEMMLNLWNYEYDKNNRSVDVYIHSLKRKLKLNQEIVNKRGIGYMLNIE